MTIHRRLLARPAVVLAVVVVALLALSACGEAGQPAASPSPTPSSRLGMASSPTAPEQDESSSGTGEALIRILDPWARPSAQAGEMSTSAVYLVIRNQGQETDRLLHAESDVAETVELHRTTMDGGMMKMEPVQAIEVPAGSDVELKPGGLHIMLIGLKRDLEVGDRVTVTLRFERAGEMEVVAEVRQP
ncbi:copper chaperone PCu(A)C [Thermomicrobiaceae bacterium CFH 74404]|uniref:Copper chaperone PCu(A)C n=2 Tax=Thermomicrobia TaxID=189775 RepID=A0AA41WGN7_9BACT|nr:copper chaperone PCu(A)C [Thermalbibacter longus]MCM8750264.1 copper chaperone PCu(A)C [Thermalbibacter longus]